MNRNRLCHLRPTLAALLLGLAVAATAQEEPTAERESPWLLTPTVSSDPKLGTTLGAIGGYLHRFDPGSTPSMFAAFGTYSDTDSHVAGLFADTYFGGDQHKIKAGAITGKIRNDYDDFLGTGLPAKTEDSIDSLFLRYSYRVAEHWYLGGQVMSSNYAIGAEGLLGDFLGLIGFTGFDSTGVGLVAERESRDNVRNSTRGSHFVAHNIAYRESLGGDESFDVYHAKYEHFFPFGQGNVLGMQLVGRWTDDAPQGGYSSVTLRGYTRGNYLAEHYSHLDLDARFPIAQRWSLTAFAGVGCLYSSVSDCGDSDDLYPAGGVGVFYLLRPRAGFVIRADYAVGKEDNSAFYLTLGQPF